MTLKKELKNWKEVKLKNKFILIILFPFFYYNLKAQDTIIVNNNYKYKIGAKFIYERTAYFFDMEKQVYDGGLQFIYKMQNSNFSIESGIYKTTKATDYYYTTPYWAQYLNGLLLKTTVFYHYVSIPVNFRFDTKVAYLSGGINVDYLYSKNARYSSETDSIDYYGTDRTLNLSVNLNVGMEKQIIKELNFFAEGRYYRTITSAKAEEDFFEKNFKNFGFAIGVNYNMK